MLGNSLAARKERWRATLAGGPGTGHLFLIPYEPDALPRPLPWPTLQAERTAWAWETYQRQRERAEWLRDDSIPHLSVYTGTEIFAEAFGCDVHRPSDDMPCAKPLVQAAAEAARLPLPRVEGSSLAMLFEIADELRSRAPEATLKIVDLQSPMDTAGLIWNKTDFFAAMGEDPQAVKELAAKVAALMTSFLDLWFARYGGDFVAHYPDYYLPAGVTLSEDDIGAVSAATFNEFYRPELVAFSARYGGLGLHCCADAVHQWANFAALPGLRLLNLVQPEEVVRKAYPFFAERVVQYHSWPGDGPPWAYPASYPPGARVVIEAGASTRVEACELANRLGEACGRG